MLVYRPHVLAQQLDLLACIVDLIRHLPVADSRRDHGEDDPNGGNPFACSHRRYLTHEYQSARR